MEYKKCTKCNQHKTPSSFYKQTKASDGLNTWCKSCINLGMKLHARKRKKEAIELLGGKCFHCNGVFHQSVYDFHHIDPTEKENGIAKLLQSYSVDNPKVKQELHKCILLCSNCHRELHSKDTEENDICSITGKGGSCGI